MKKIYLTPGPSQLYPTVASHIKTAIKEELLSVSHRSIKFQEIFSEAVSNLKQLLTIPHDYQIFFLPSATEAMERIIQNSVEHNSFHFVNGAFSDSFSKISQDLKKTVSTYQVDPGSCFEFNDVKIPSSTELLTFTQNETSTGYAMNLQDVYNIHKKFPAAFIAIDIVSSIPYVDVDYSQIDYAFFSVQKGFGLPAGLGVLIISPRGIKRAEELLNKGISIGSYHTFPKLSAYAVKNQTPETPNVLGIYLLGKISGDMLKTGIKTIRTQTEHKASLLYSFFDTHPDYTPFISCGSTRSQTVIVAECKKGSQTVIDRLKTNGIIVGSGYKEFKTKHIRIANFPSHTEKDIKKLISLLSTD